MEMVLLLALVLPVTDPVFIFALVMMIILVVPLLFDRLGIPAIVGLILAGVVVGPSSTGLLARDATFELLGTVGLLYIMFLAGLEISLAQFSRRRNQSLAFGGLTFLVPQLSGTLLAVYALDFSWTAGVLLASMFASHTLLSYPIASRLGIGRSEPVTTAVGGTIITDTAALLVLVVIARSVTGALTAAFWFRLAIGLTVFVILVFWALPRVGRWFFRLQRAESTSEFVFVIAALFLSALASKLAGVEPIIGAFMAGLALNRLVPEQSVLMNRIQFAGDAIFIPFFLISVGMLVDISIFSSGPDGWIVAGFMTSTVLVTKYVAADVCRRLFRYSRDGGRLLFALTIPQAAATLAAVVVGYDLGIFGDEVLNGTIFMILITCLLSPWIVEKYGRRMALDQERRPQHFIEESHRILVPISNPSTATTLMDVALMIRDREADEPIYPLVVVTDGRDVDSRVLGSKKVLAHAVARAAMPDVAVHPLTRVDMNVADGIIRTIRERRISKIVIGWNGERSASERIFGSVVDQLLSATREQVIVCKIENPLNTVRRLVLVLPPHSDRQPGFAAAIASLVRLADRLGIMNVVISRPKTRVVVERISREMVQSMNIQFVELAAHHALMDPLEFTTKDSDLVAVLSSRAGSLTWHPDLDKLPRTLAERTPATDFIVVYPSQETAEEIIDAAFPTETSLAPVVRPEYVLVDHEVQDMRLMVERLLKSAFANEVRLVEPIVEHLIASADDYDAELKEGVVFLHHFSSQIRQPMIFMGISRHGVRLDAVRGRTYVLIIALNPDGTRSPSYLGQIARIARRLGDAGLVERLRRAASSSEARAMLLEGV